MNVSCETEGHVHDEAVLTNRARVVHCHEHGHYRNAVNATQHLVTVHAHVHWHRAEEPSRRTHTHRHGGAFWTEAVLGCESSEVSS